MLTFTEENYIKELYHITDRGHDQVTTNGIASALSTSPAAASAMLKRLTGKGLVNHLKYKGAVLSEEGKEVALEIIRKHRLWETFLVNKLNFCWDEVHEVAEQLEHIHSPLLIERLDAFLEYPKFDPHGDPIPDKNGKFDTVKLQPLSETALNLEQKLVTVKTDNNDVLRFLDKIALYPGATIKVVDKNDFDKSIEVYINNSTMVFISDQIAQNLLVGD